MAAITRLTAHPGPASLNLSEALPLGQRQLTRREFFTAVTAGLDSKLPQDLTGYRHRANGALLKIDYGNERVHFEVWVDGARNRVEIGLHFEDGPASTAAYLAFFDARIVEIKHHLGWEIELERWTLAWGHLFESVPLMPLNDGFVDAIADRLTRQITVLQPLVVEAAVPQDDS